MRALLILAFSLVLGSAEAGAASFSVGENLPVSAGTLSVTAVQECSQGSGRQSADGLEFLEASDNVYEYSRYAAAELSCRARTRISDAFQVATVSLTLVGAITACTTVGAPAAVWLGLGAGITGSLELVVRKLPCKDDATDREAVQMSVTTICEALAARGVECVE